MSSSTLYAVVAVKAKDAIRLVTKTRQYTGYGKITGDAYDIKEDLRYLYVGESDVFWSQIPDSDKRWLDAERAGLARIAANLGVSVYCYNQADKWGDCLLGYAVGVVSSSNEIQFDYPNTDAATKLHVKLKHYGVEVLPALYVGVFQDNTFVVNEQD